MTDGRSNRNTHNNRQPWHWIHGNSLLWREWRWIRICRVTQKLTHDIVQNSITRGPHPQNPTYAWDCRRGYQWDHPTNGFLHPARLAWPYRACRRRYHPSRKTPIKWCFTSARHPTILAALTHDRRLRRHIQSSATPPCSGRRLRPPSERIRPPQSTHWGSQLCPLCCLPVLVTPKSCK